MKKLIQITIALVFINVFYVAGQNIYKDYADGRIYMKIKKEIQFDLNKTTPDINLKSELSFLVPLIDRYKITNAEATFYFAKSDILKRTLRVSFDKPEKVNQFINDLEKISQVEYAEKIPIVMAQFSPNDLQANTYSGQYGLYNIHAKEAWDVARGSSGVIIAIVDVAIDPNHSDLSGIAVAGQDVSDLDNNTSPPNTLSKWEHGTHCSGIACAQTNNGNGIAAIGFGCSLMPVKATHDNNSNNPLTITEGYQGITWAATNGADVISCSWGGYASNITEQSVIDYAYSQNAIVIAAAGNDSTSSNFYPASYNHVLSVAATNIADNKAGFSNFGNWVDVSAPGVAIYSTVLSNSYTYLSGTSMSCPLVAGLCGLIRSLNGSLSYDDIVSCVVNTADNIDAQNPNFIGQLGSGRINAYRAVECALPCNGSINLGSGVYTTLKTESSGTITSANNIAVNAQVAFDAATTVFLEPNFIANNGSTFHAYINGCGGARFQGPDNQNSLFTHSIKGFNSLIVKPNPFSSHTTISYNLLQDEKVDIKIYNTQMQLVSHLLNQSQQSKGEHQIDFEARDLPAGIYLCKLETADKVSTVKIVLNK